MSVLAPSYCKEKKRIELNLIMFRQRWERAQYFFSKVKKISHAFNDLFASQTYFRPLCFCVISL